MRTKPDTERRTPCKPSQVQPIPIVQESQKYDIPAPGKLSPELNLQSPGAGHTSNRPAVMEDEQ